MTAHLELGTLTTELTTVLATETGLAVGDGVSPVAGNPADTDYPYLVVYEISIPPSEPEIGKAPSTTRVTWQVSAVGISRLQAARARDFATRVLDPGIAIETTDARVIDRFTVSSTMMGSDGGRIWTAVWRLGTLVTAL